MRESWWLYTTQLIRAHPLALAGIFAGALLLTAHNPVLAAGVVSGAARVIDGDTLEISGTRVRLEGIDAPERGQRCRRAWLPGRWRCGRAATRALNKLIGSNPVVCKRSGIDKYRRILGICFVGDVDINARLVRTGNAWAFTKYSKRYIKEEAIARAAKHGIWQAETEPAWVFRKKKWAVSEQQVPDGCAIKGNISSNGRIYHMPWSPWYAKVRINEQSGERWFCTEREAAAAGWRPVRGA